MQGLSAVKVIRTLFVCLFPSPLQLLSELYHEDKGFNHNRTVFLSERPPSNDVEHALACHPASRKLEYLQGIPFRPEVLPAVLCG